MIALAAFLVGLLIIVYFENDAPQTAEQSLTDIENIDTLRTQFDRDAGKIRLIMIVSPT